MNQQPATNDHRALLKNSLLELKRMQAKLQAAEQARIEPIAIVGMGCRFPKAPNLEVFWQLLEQGIDAATEVPKERWDIDQYYDPEPGVAGKMYTRHGNFITDVDQFDPEFFRISPREAKNLDPQHRLLLEVCWESLEYAGLSPLALKGSQTGVFIGMMTHDYQQLVAHSGDLQSAFGTGAPLAAGRIAYTLGLNGPTLTLETACSSSLVACHLACQSLRNQECNLALVGGVNLMLTPQVSVFEAQTRMNSVDGRCKTFDQAADGYGRGEGCGVVVLKRLSDAQADGDQILAVIRGSAVNHDGASSGLTVPNGLAQESVIRQALSSGKLEASQVDYIECHGTGTPLGDPIEVEALANVYGPQRRQESPLMIGSVKTNIGHTEGAAGIAGLIKVILSLQQDKIPPHLHLKQPNPRVDWEDMPVTIPTEVTPWLRGDRSRLAGVSSFGVSGTNAHVIVAEAPPSPVISKNADQPERPWHVLTLSAKTEAGLRSQITHYRKFLDRSPDLAIANICHTTNQGRAHFAERIALVGKSVDDFSQTLYQLENNEITVGAIEASRDSLNPPEIIFLFTGQGAQYPDMGRELYKTQPLFQQTLDHCNNILRPYLDLDILTILYPDLATSSPPLPLSPSPLNQTTYTQPALFALEYALYKLWQSWGIQPSTVMGHSIGEYVAACVAGVFSLEDGLKLMAMRGKLMQQLPAGGAMVSVMASSAQVKAVIAEQANVTIAAINGPESTVISGDATAVQSMAQQLEGQGIKTKQLQVSHAFHSPLMQPMLADFKQVAQQISYSTPKLKLISNVTGQVINEEIATPEYWCQHILAPVKFAAGMERLQHEKNSIFLECGPQPILLGMGRQCLPEDENKTWLPSLRSGKSDWQQMLTSLGDLYIRGVKIDWASFDQDYPQRRKVALPTYPFQRQRYWVDATEEPTSQAGPVLTSQVTELLNQGDVAQLTQLLAGQSDLDIGILERLVQVHQQQLAAKSVQDLIYELQWAAKGLSPSQDLPNGEISPRHWIIVSDSAESGTALVEQLQTLRQTCSRVVLDNTVANRDDNSVYALKPESLADFEPLWKQVKQTSSHPIAGIIWLGNTTGDTPNLTALESAISSLCQPLLFLMQSLVQQPELSQSKLWVITQNAVSLGTDLPTLAQGPMRGMSRIFGLEHPQQWGGMVDLDGSMTVAEQAKILVTEVLENQTEEQVAYRNGSRYVARLSKCIPEKTTQLSISSEGSYLITGGLGGLGLVVAQWLVEQGSRHLILLSRRGADTLQKQAAVTQLQSSGVNVITPMADVGDEVALTMALQELPEFSSIKGVIHIAGIGGGAYPIAELDSATLQQTLHPKVAGAWNLHQLSLKWDLDFFVNFSSIASVWGSAQQAHYGAANEFQNLFAQYRRVQGLPILTVNWSAIAGAGMLTDVEDQLIQRLSQLGVTPLTLPQMTAALTVLLGSNDTQRVVAAVDWSQFDAVYQVGRPRQLLEQLVMQSVGQSTSQSRKNLIQHLRALPAAQRDESLHQNLSEGIAHVLGLPDGKKLKPTQDLFELGMDSLMAVELRNRLQQHLGVEIPVSKFMGGVNLATLEDVIRQQWEDLDLRDLNVDTAGSQPELSIAARADVSGELLTSDALTQHHYPLSFNQKALWFIWNLAPDSYAYNVSFPVRLMDANNLASWRGAFQQFIERHAILRSCFPSLNDQPQQQILDANTLDFQVMDATAWDQLELRQQVTAAHRAPFDLDAGPLFRVRCFQLAEQEILLLISMHHIVYDGWSLSLLLDELPILYRVQQTQQLLSLTPPSHTYQEFVQWQQQLLTSAKGDQLWHYWQTQLQGQLPVLRLPLDRPRPPVQTYRGGSCPLRLSTSLTNQLKTLAETRKVSLYTLLLTAYQVFLHRYTQQDDIIVGSPVAGRTRSDFTQVFGYFLNLLPIRTVLRGTASFAEVLTQTQHTLGQALDHQDFPFALMVERLQPRRDPSYSPIFQTIFILQNFPQGHVLAALDGDSPQNWGGINVRPYDLPQFEGQFDLSLEMVESSAGLTGAFKYNSDLFEEDTITRMLGQFETMLAAIANDPQQPIYQLPLLTEGEQHQLLALWNDTAVDYDQHQCIHQLFDEQVERTPDAIALIVGPDQLSYRDLNTRAEQLALHLQYLGVGPEVLVGICVERSLEMMVGLLGILKAGGAYVPLDPEYPQQRLAFMLEDAQISVLLTQERLLSVLPTQDMQNPATQIICLDRDWDTIRQGAGDFPQLLHRSEWPNPTPVTANNLAYVIYTSGSTGKPKGVMIEHQQVMNFFTAMDGLVEVGDRKTWLALTTISFDISILEVFWTLTAGFKVILQTNPRHIATTGSSVAPPQQFLESSRALDQHPNYTVLNQIQTHQVTHLQCTPSWLRMLMATPDGFNCLGSLHHLLVGGEALSPALAQTIRGAMQGKLHNMYGPTETTIWSTSFDIEPVEKTPLLMTAPVPESAQAVAIGQPIANTQIYILDAHLQLVPVGLPGELHIGGAGLARGYWNRPDLTAKKFITNPFGVGQLYKTGDLARWRSDGTLEFLGRIDHQVKLNGFRIEVGDIETALGHHPGVQAAVVMVQDVGSGASQGDICQQMVTYFVPKPTPENPPTTDAMPTSQILREFLKTRLPQYMVPNHYVSLSKFPLTPNNKIDRQALLGLNLELEQSQNFVAPNTERQTLIADHFASVLSLPPEKIGIHDSFFDLGGHSLLATQLVARLRQTFEIELPLHLLFESPTIAGIDAIFHQDLQPSVMPTITPRPQDNEPIPLSYAQERLWVLGQLEGISATYNIAGTVRINGTLNIETLQQAINEMVRRHEVLRTTFTTDEGIPVLQISQTMTIPVQVIEVADLEASLSDWLAQEAKQPFNLRADALLRVTLLRLGEATVALSITMHHIISDGWSMGVFMRELADLYKAYDQNQPSPLSPLPIQYADYILWQRQWLQGEILEAQLDYWRHQLAHAPALLNLPTDRLRPAVQTFQGQTHTALLPPILRQRVNDLAQQHGVTLFMALLTAFQVLLYRYSGQRDIVVGSAIANRQQPELEALIGYFANTLVLRTQIDSTDTIVDLFHKVREMTLGAYAHQDVPFERVVAELQPERSLAYSPLFQVMFVLQNTPVATLELSGVTLTPMEVQTATAKVDLILWMNETEQGLVGNWEYNCDLFDASTIARMAAHFETLLNKMGEAQSQTISSLSILSETERQQLLLTWNYPADYRLDSAPDLCIHELFEAQVAQTPDAIAVVFEGEQISYQTLNTRANQLAHYLQGLGVRPEVLVGICIERSIDMVIGLLGILKAGGGYVPLDPGHPQQRLQFMLEDAQAPILITQTRCLELLPPDHRAQVVCLDRDWDMISQASSENLSSGVTPENLAYAIYTSGSTGMPKGVLIPHGNVANLFKSVQAIYHFNAQDCWTLFHSYAFDFSVWELWGALLHGSRLVIVPQWMTRSPQEFYDLLVSHQVTVLNQTPAAFLQIIQIRENYPSDVLKLRHVILGGEALQTQNLEPWFEWYGDNPPQLTNMYGPTEATVWSTSFWVEQLLSTDHSHPDQVTPIGRPLTNTQAYILDEQLQPVPIGVPGELHIGGRGLARGYLNRPELTAEKFIANPFGEERLYKTGDLVRYLTDGNIEFLGRLDHQVKVRGFRIELGEIEAVISGYDHVQQCLVTVREDIPTQKDLVAYVVGNQEFSHESLKIHLKQRLPDYMVPRVIVPLASLPLTTNGKVDRKALPLPNQALLHQTIQYVAPETDMEKMLTEIWQSVLHTEQVGIQDNFFDSGGNSLLLIQAHHRIQEKLDLTIPLVELFAYPTIKALSHYLVNLTSASIPALQNERVNPDRHQVRSERNRRRQTRQRHRKRD